MFDKEALFIISNGLIYMIRWYENRINYLKAAEKEGLDISLDLQKTEEELAKTQTVYNEVRSFL